MYFSLYDVVIHLSGIAYVGVEIAIHKMTKDENQSNRKSCNNRSLLLIWIMIGVSVLSGVLFRNILEIGNIFDKEWSLTVIGLLLIIIGVAIRLMVIFTLGKAFSVNLSVNRDQKLVITGIYKKIRHPGYMGALISMLGIGLLFLNIWVVLIFFLLNSFSIINRINVEEKMLKAHFEEKWDEYCKKSYRLIYFVY